MPCMTNTNTSNSGSTSAISDALTPVGAALFDTVTIWNGPIALSHYWMRRNVNAAYASEVTPKLIANATETVQRVNALIEAMRADGVIIEWSPTAVGRTPITSGWRPQAINSGTPGAAVRSLHITAQACDLFDPEGALDSWCMTHKEKLAQIGLWLEHPSATKGWCHVQTVAPRSGNRVFYP
jgi:hypothetical protein